MRGFRFNLRCARGSARRADGFSFIELLVVLALIIIISVMFFSFGSKSHQQRQKLACEKNLQTMYVALELFATESGGAFPAVTNARTSDQPLGLLVPKYISLTEPFICPGSKDNKIPEGEGISGRRISYSYYMGWRVTDTAEPLVTDEQVNIEPKIKGHPVFSRSGKRPGNNHHRYGGNYLFCDGRTEASPPIAPYSLLLTQGVVLLNPKRP